MNENSLVHVNRLVWWTDVLFHALYG